MEQIIAAIEQEWKYVSDSENGTEQYWKGYARALEAVKEFLKVLDGARTSSETSCPEVQRLLSFGSLQPGNGSAFKRHRGSALAQTLTALEKDALEIALGVLRSDTDYGDFLNFWLRSYGAQVLAPDPPPPLLRDSEAKFGDADTELESVIATGAQPTRSTMQIQPSFGVIGLTRTELDQQQVLMDISRGFPAEFGKFMGSLKALLEGKLPANNYLPHHHTFDSETLG